MVTDKAGIMTESIFDRIKAATPTYIRNYLEREYPSGKWENSHRFRMGDATGGDGESFCFDLNIMNGKDFAGDFSGDIIDMMMAKYSMNKKQAAERIAADWGLVSTPAKKKEKERSRPIHPIPPGKNLTIDNYFIEKYGEVTATWTYQNTDKEPIGHVVRFDKDGKKNFTVFQYCEPGKWAAQGFDAPRPLYNLPSLRRKATTLVVEGEKAADAAKTLFPALNITTWTGGASAVKQTNWTPLSGQPVIIWRDNDKPGKDAEDMIAGILSDLGCQVRVFKEDALEDRPKGWDIADLVAEGELLPQQALDWLKDNIMEYQRGGADSPALSVGVKKSAQPLNTYFKCLGMVGNRYCFYNYSSGRVTDVGHDSVSEMFLRSLTKGMQSYWETEDGKKPDWKAQAGSLMAQCQDKGQFSMGKVRGRGTWEDSGKFVTNTGDGVIVDDIKLAMSEFDSDYVYLRSEPLDQSVTPPVEMEELQQLLEVIEGLRWEDGVCGKLMAGWIMAAPVCGALPWRSHLYISGPAGSGKTWIYENIISRILKKVSLRASSKTTEAGIRHKLGPDAFPVIFDEAEAENLKDAERMQQIMDLARQASSEDGAPILKGTAGQEGAKEFYIRSSFCFLSIMPSIRQHADETRTTILTLKHRDDTAPDIANTKFKSLVRSAAGLLKGDFEDRFISYSRRAVRAMRENFRIFADQGVLIYGSKRIADQLAMLLAGYYAYFSDGVITEEDAKKLLAKYNWQAVIPSKESNNQARLLMRISQYQIEVQVKQDPAKRYTRSIGELIEYMASLREPDTHIIEGFSESDVDAALKRRGIRYDNEHKAVMIANHSEFLKTILANSPWSANWSIALKAIPGACIAEKTISFGGFNSRAMSIPVLTFLDTSDIK